MGEIVPGNGKYGAAGFFATERALSYVLLFACVAVVFTCAFLVWRDVEPLPADPVEARRSVTVELDLRHPPAASPSVIAAVPSGAPSTVAASSPSPSISARPVAVVGVPVTSGQALPSPAPATSPEPSPGASETGDATPSPGSPESPAAAPAPKVAPKAAPKAPKSAKAGKPGRVVALPSAGSPGARRTPPPMEALRVPDVPIPGGTTPPSWQPPAPAQPPVVLQPSMPSQPSYPVPSDPSAPATVTLIGQLIHPVQDQGGASISDQVILVNLSTFQSTRGNLGADGSFTFTNLVPRARYCLSAWHHRRSSAGGVAPGAPGVQGGAFEAKLSWHQAVVVTRSGTYSVSLNPQNADPFYCVDQLLPNDLPGRQSSLRAAELQLIQRQGYR